MNSSLSLKILAVGLACSASALAQAPPPSGPLAVPRQAAGPMGMPLPTRMGGQPSIQSSRIRAFNPGPDGQIRNLYLSNGSVVNLSPNLGRHIAAVVTKGERVRVSGFRSDVNGQTVIAANSLTLRSQTFVTSSDTGLVVDPDRLPPPPPPPGGPNLGPGHRSGREMARLGPGGPVANGPGPNGPPPPSPPTHGPRPPRPQGNQPDLLPSDGNQPRAAPSPIDPNEPVQSGAPVAPPTGQPASPGAQPNPNGPSV